MTESPGPPPIVDTHTHLDDPAFDLDRDTVIGASRAVGVRHFVNIGYAPDRWESSRALRERHPDIDFALGLHPQLAEQYDTSLGRDLRRAIEALAPVAVGETGSTFRDQHQISGHRSGRFADNSRSLPPHAFPSSSISEMRRMR